MLCAICISMFQNFDKTREGDHHATVHDLIKAAQSGCRICIFENQRREQYGTKEGHAISERPLLRYKFKGGEEIGGNYWRIVFESGASWATDQAHNVILIHVVMAEISTPDKYRILLELVKEDLKEQPWYVRRDDFDTREIPSNTGDDASLKVAEDWLRDCKKNHKLCENAYGKSRSGWYPKRLVVIGEDESKTRLVVPDEEHITGGYAALSHCWGNNSSFVTLTSDNYEQFRNNISITVLPKSFRDAIHACRRLSIKYIWIDSLCILQSGEGSGNDWLYHATDMEMVYSNCVLNLAIAHASSPHEGAFVERNSDFLQDCYLWAPLSSPNPEQQCPRNEFLYHNLPNDDLPKDDLTNEDLSKDDLPNEKLRMCVIFVSATDSRGSRMFTPLSSRGWVLQERLLSSRVLHFQQDRIAWECQEAALSEYIPSGIPCGCDFDIHYKPPFNLPLQLEEKQREPVQPEPGLKVTTRAAQSHRWSENYWDVVSEYTCRELSFPAKDKLVAFSSVAKQFGPAFGNEYSIGIFRDDMPEGLLWRGVRSRRQEKWRAPSWSWASVDCFDTGFVTSSLVSWMIQDGTMEALASVEDVQVELVDPSNRYGQVTSGKLLMRGMVLPWNNGETGVENNSHGTEEVQRSTTKTKSEHAADEAQLYSSGSDRGSGNAEGPKEALYSVSATPTRQRSNHKLFEFDILRPSGIEEVSGYHHGFHTHFSIDLDEEIQDKPKLDECFLLPIFELIPQSKNAARPHKRYPPPTDRSWGLILARRDDGSYTRLGVYSSADRCLGRDAIGNGMEQQVISIL